MIERHLLEEFRRALLSISEIPSLPKEIFVPLIQRGIIRELLNNPTQESIAALEEVCAFAPLPVIREDALEALIQLSHQNYSEAILGLYRLAVERDYLPAISYLRNNSIICPNPHLQAVFSFLHLPEADYTQFSDSLSLLAEYFFYHAQPSTRTKMVQSTDTPGRKRFSHLLDTLLLDTPEKSSRLLALYPQSSEVEKQIILQRLSSLVEMGSISAGDLLCQLVIHFDDSAAGEMTKRFNLTPSSPSDKALYYFLSNQWDQYETFDFTHQWLVEAYSTASPTLRQKILSQARNSGYIEWLSNLSGSRPAVVLWELSPADWEKIAQAILSNPPDPSWLRLLSHAPLYWSAYLLNYLEENAYGFEGAPELNRVAQLAATSISQPLPYAPQAVLRSPAGSITCMAVSPFGMEVGFGSLDASIQFLNLTSIEWQKPILSPASPTRLIAYDPQAGYLVCAGGDHRLRIFRRQDDVLLKTLEGHKGLVRAIAFQSDGRIFYSAGFDGTIHSWHFPSGLAARSPIRVGNEIFSLLISSDNQLLLYASAERTCQVISVQENQPVHSVSGLDDVPLTLALNYRQKFAVAFRNNKIQQFSLSTFKPLTTPRSIPSPINRLIYHPSLPLLFGMGVDGKIHVWHEADLRLILTIEQHNQPASGLGITPDGNILISSSADGKVLIWDLQPFLLFFQPVHSDLHAWIEKLALWLKTELSPSSRAWLEFAQRLLEWRARFDIQIEDAVPIQIGDFDILF